MIQKVLCVAIVAAVCILEAQAVGEAPNTCTTDAQCQANTTDSYCYKFYGSACDSGVCVCHSDKILFNDTCISGVAYGGACETIGYSSNCANYVDCIGSTCQCSAGATNTGSGCVTSYSGLGNACNVTSDCDQTNGQMCNTNCECIASYKMADTVCEPKELGDNCSSTADCANAVFSECINSTCTCPSGTTMKTTSLDSWTFIETVTSTACYNTSSISFSSGSGSNCEFDMAKYLAGTQTTECTTGSGLTCAQCPTDELDMSSGIRYTGVCTSFSRVAVESSGGGGGGGSGSDVTRLHPISLMIVIVAALMR